MMNCTLLDALFEQKALATVKLREAVTALSRNRSPKSEQAVRRAYDAREAMRRAIDAHILSHGCFRMNT